MSLRAYFAGQALQGILAGALADGSRITEDAFNPLARNAIRFADTLIAELNKTNP